MKKFFQREKVAILFFLLYFLVGILALPDYGIAWDEFYQESIGQVNLEFVLRKGSMLTSPIYPDKYFGPAYELFIAGTRKIFAHGIPDMQELGRNFLLYRHVVNFLTFFVGMIFFYLLCRHHFKEPYVSLLGTLMLILSPPFFAHVYYNSKDTAFMAFFIVLFYALIRFIEKRTWGTMLCLAIATGLAMSVRIATIIVPVFAFGSILVDELLLGQKNKKRRLHTFSIVLFVLYILIAGGVMYATYPILWVNPVGNFLHILYLFTHFTLEVPNLYFGQYIIAQHLPWHYVPVWIGITTPILYLFFFGVGVIDIIKQLPRGIARLWDERKEDVLIFGWFFGVVIPAIVLRTPQFNGWRHMFFVYPALILFALKGVQLMTHRLAKYVSHRVATATIVLILFINFFFLGKTIVELHPYEHLYFNALAGGDMNRIRSQFDLDYWGLSYKEGIRFLLAYDTRSPVVIQAETYPAWANSYLLSKKDRDRLIFNLPGEDWTKKPKPMYYMTSFFMSRKEPSYTELYSFRVRGAKIMSVYKMPE